MTFQETQFLDQMALNPFSITKVTELYLSGFGNTTIPGSADSTFVLTKPNLHATGGLPGFFGPLIPNAGAYHSYPSPGVASQRMMEDLRLTANPDGPVAWQLLADQPAELPAPELGPQPTPFCIGYEPAVRLRPEAVNALHSCGITVDNFQTSNDEIPFNAQILNWVHYYLEQVRDLVICTPPTARTGSQAQMVTATVDNDNNHCVVNSPFQINGSIVYLSSCFKYRLQIPAIRLLQRVPFAGANEQQMNAVLAQYNADNALLGNFLYGSISTDASLRLKTIVKLNFGT